MNQLTDPSLIRELLAKHGFHFSKALGQNFLINPSVCPRMAELSGACAQTGVLEIGPGLGVLTAELAKRAKKVVAVELDERLLPVLAESLGEYDNVKIIQGDVLKADLGKILAEEFDTPVDVCANLPYYITSPVLMRLLESRLPVRSITVMVQKEAGRRICAEPGSRESGAVTIAVHYYARPCILFDVSAGSFMPRPKVDSCVIRLDIHPEPPVAVKDKKQFFRIVRAAFGQRRKTLLNALSAGLGVPRQTVSEGLRRAGIPEGERGEKLTLEDFARISNTFLQ